MSRIYIYKMTVDDGGAPCIRGGLLTLAICKPAIRRTAKVGNIIMAFAANHVYGWRPKGSYRQNSLIYIAEVTETLSSGKYYAARQYQHRPDCIYEWQDGVLKHRSGALFHSNADRRRDVGERWSGYKNARVLLSDKFKYFADSGPSPHQPEMRFLSKLINNLNQGHRVYVSKALPEEIQAFEAEAWSLKSRFTSTPIPKQPCKRICDRDRCYTAVRC